MESSAQHNSISYWSAPGLAGIALLRAHLAAHDYPPHVHDGFVIAVTERGGASITNNGKRENVGPFSLFLSNPFEPQSAATRRGEAWMYRSFYVPSDALRSAISGPDQRLPRFRACFAQDPRLASDLLALHRACETSRESDANSEALLESLAATLRACADGAPEEVRPARRAVGIARDLIHARFAEPLRLAELSAAAGVTPYHLIGVFRREMGITPHAYLTQVRLHAGRRLLLAGVAIAEVATRVGFYDQSALTRSFKRSYGVTPSRFVRAHA